MKKCLFFFLALVLAIALETMIGSAAVVDDVQAQTASNYTKEDREVQDITPEWSPLELKDAEVSQAQNP